MIQHERWQLRSWKHAVESALQAAETLVRVALPRLEGLKRMSHNHVGWAEKLAERPPSTGQFRHRHQTGPIPGSFRHLGGCDLDAYNLALVSAIDANAGYLTQTRIDGRIAIRFQPGQFDTTEEDADAAFGVITASECNVI